MLNSDAVREVVAGLISLMIVAATVYVSVTGKGTVALLDGFTGAVVGHYFTKGGVMMGAKMAGQFLPSTPPVVNQRAAVDTTTKPSVVAPVPIPNGEKE